MSREKIRYGGKGMSRVVLNTDLKEVKEVRITCQKCGSVNIRPITKYGENIPNTDLEFRCLHCGQGMDSELVDAVRHLNIALVAIHNDTSGFSIEIETEEKA